MVETKALLQQVMMSSPWLLLVLLLPVVVTPFPHESSQTKEERDLSDFLEEQLAMVSRKEFTADHPEKHLELRNGDQHHTDGGYNSLLAIIRDYVEQEKRACLQTYVGGVNKPCRPPK